MYYNEKDVIVLNDKLQVLVSLQYDKASDNAVKKEIERMKKDLEKQLKIIPTIYTQNRISKN